MLFSIDSVVRGHHVYKDIWSPEIGEILQCQIDSYNIHDMYAVAVKRDGISIVGHVPRTISTPCHLFLRKGSNITCEITGSREFSRDLPQGGLDVPCHLIFEASKDLKLIDKVKKVMDDAPPYSTEKQADNGFTPVSSFDSLSKMEQVDDANEGTGTIIIAESSQDVHVDSTVWLKMHKITLLQSDRKYICTHGTPLNDKHINLAQRILKTHCPHVDGLQSTLL